MSPTPPMTTPTTTSKVFVYGSLRSTEVLHALLQRTPICAKGSLASPAYKRVCVRDAPYPAVIRSSATTTSGGIVDGLLLRDITPNELELFDAFEDEYERIPGHSAIYPYGGYYILDLSDDDDSEVRMFVLLRCVFVLLFTCC